MHGSICLTLVNYYVCTPPLKRHFKCSLCMCGCVALALIFSPTRAGHLCVFMSKAAGILATVYHYDFCKLLPLNYHVCILNNA